jgi:hypothetical protein
MPLLEEHRVSVPAVVDETAARRELRRQIADLERQLSDALVTAFPYTAVDVQVPGRSGPRILELGDLEVQRDALGAKLREVREVLTERSRQVEANHVLLERMLLEPKRYKFTRLYRSELDQGGCGAYHVHPRLGIIGMLMGWWHVKLSSGCPLATSHGTP